MLRVSHEQRQFKMTDIIAIIHINCDPCTSQISNTVISLELFLEMSKQEIMLE